MWLRLAKPYAGDTYGWHAPLLDGTEVAVMFDSGDPDRPYIAYAQHDSEHTDHVTSDNHTRNVLRTPANNKLRLEDRRGEEHIKLATEYGKSQLNMGHLVDAQREQRGTGFELRTDEYGAVRAAKGIFLAAHEQPKAQGQVLEMTPAVNQITQANSQMQALSVRDPLVKNVVDRLAVKHHSEWSKGRSTGRWEGFYKDLDMLEVEYCEKWQAELEWMSKVPPFDKDEAVWHFHPVVFLDTIADKYTGVIEFQISLGIYRISKKSAEFILKEEGYMASPYVPENSNSSGVTLGYGFDLGQQTIATMRATISDFYTEQQLSRLEAAIGFTG